MDDTALDRLRPAPTTARIAVAILTLAGLAVATPWLVQAAAGILGAPSTSPIEWVPRDFPARRTYDRFTAEFESCDVLVASWPDCTLDSPSLAAFVAAATGPAAPRDTAGHPWFSSVTTGDTVLARLTAPPLELDRETAVDRLRGVLVGPDGRTTCAVVGFTREGLVNRREAVAWIRDLLLRTAVAPDAELHLAGPVVDNVTVDEASADSIHTYGVPAALVILGLTWRSLRSFRFAVLVFLLSLASVGVAFASLAAWGDRMSPVLIAMPVLVLTLGVSGGIHLVNYLTAAVGDGPRHGVAAAVRLAWLPCSLSAATTAVGLASLVVSDLEPIRVFGFHGAVGVLATLGLLFLVVPGILERWPPRPRRQYADRGNGHAEVADAIIRRAPLVLVVAAAVMLGTATGLPGLRTSVALQTLFAPESRLLADYAWLERHVAPLQPIEAVVRFSADSGLRAVERLDLVRRIAATLDGMPEVEGVVSAATFMPDIEERTGALGAAGRVVVARRLEKNLACLADLAIVRETGGAQLWRITARTSAFAGIDDREFLARARGLVEPLVAGVGGRPGVDVSFTGPLPLVGDIQRTLLHDLFTSFLSACGLIALVMMVVEGGVAAGLVAMVPNVFPMVILFGLFGWTRLPLDIGSVMTASIALGMAVDGTFHFLAFFRRHLAGAAAPRSTAIRAAFVHSAAALTHSAIVCGLGILVLAGSSFAPTRRFAWMMAALVAIALVGDLVLLPSLLASPLGRCFRPQRSRH
jgi:predicted RND superfamily exporter protein